ncbi:MAG: hypothetical protein ABR564_06255 [Candidatus Dormibacteria bacterium]
MGQVRTPPVETGVPPNSPVTKATVAACPGEGAETTAPTRASRNSESSAPLSRPSSTGAVRDASMPVSTSRRRGTALCSGKGPVQ